MKTITSMVFILVFLISISFAEEVILEKVDQVNSTTMSRNATCKIMKTPPVKVKAPKGEISAWAKFKIKDNEFLVCVITEKTVDQANNGAETVTANLYFDKDKDNNLKEEKPITISISGKEKYKRFNFELTEIPIILGEAKSRLKLKINFRLLYYDYDTRKYFYVYLHDRYEGQIEAFKRN